VGAIQPKGPLCLASMAVRDHLCHPINLQHHARRNGSGLWLLLFVFVHNRDGRSFSDRRRQSLEAWRRLNGVDRDSSEREWLRYTHHISGGFDGGYIF
jgi:hypothetical protein